MVDLVHSVGLSSTDWQTLPMVINPPALNYIALGLITILHSNMGHFPAIIRIRPVKDSVPTRYEVAEIINLQQMRDRQRELR